jgi:hypothetical protein
MKKLVLIAALAVATSAGYAQGLINFSNYVPGSGLTPKIFQSDGTTPLDGTYLAQLYAGTSASSLTPVGTAATFKTGAGAGYFTGGGVAIPLTVIANPAAGGVFEVKAWLATAGTSYEAALAAGNNNTFGASTPFTLASIATAPAPASNLIGLTSFSLVGVPEPSTLVLGVLGASLFLLRRRS